MEKIPKNAIDRLIVYRKILSLLKYNGISNVFSYRLADLSDCSSAQVRRDLMFTGYMGSPANGYEVDELENSISKFLDHPDGQTIAIIGVGQLGSSLLKNCYWNYPNLSLIAAFDSNKEIVGKEIHGCLIKHVDNIEDELEKLKINLTILAVPNQDAQIITDRIIRAGVKGIINYTSIRLVVPDYIVVENMDVMFALEKVSYLIR